MKLERILDNLNSLEKGAFIKIIDNIVTSKPKNIKEIEKILSNSDRIIKNVDNNNIAQIFHLIEDEIIHLIKSEFRKTTSQLDVVIDLIIQDGNSILNQEWFSRLYENEIKVLKSKIKQFQLDIEDEKSDLSIERKRDYRIYKSCLKTAYQNDSNNNQEHKITTDELSILIALSKELELSQDEVKLINYSVIEPKKIDTAQMIEQLRNIGLLFVSKKNNTLYISDEMVRVLRKVRKKDVADKFLRRVLKLFKDPQINLICKKHNVDRKLSIPEKIETIIKNGISLRDILSESVHKDGTSLLDKRRFINEFCDKHLNIAPALKGSTVDEKLDNLLLHFDQIEKDEKVGISHDGYAKLLKDLKESNLGIEKSLKTTLNQSSETHFLQTDYLLDRNIKPADILELISEEQLLAFCAEKDIKTRGEKISNILDAYTDSENIFIENYENIGFRKFNELKEAGILLKEAELGLKFEEVTKLIFTQLGLSIDNDLKKKINTSKDMIDILINVGNNDIIIVECKTQKESGYNKFSTVSRQIKSYKGVAESNGYRVIKTLLVAPDFSDQFISECDSDLSTSEIHLSLITASSLLKILDGFKQQTKHAIFPHVLLRDVLIDENRILKAISK